MSIRLKDTIYDLVNKTTKLETARTLWGQSFNGTANVSGNMTGVGTISMSGALTLTGTDSTTALISFSRTNYNYITFPTGYSLAFGTSTGSANTLYRMTNDAFIPERTNKVSLGTSSLKWKNVYATTFTGSLSGNASSSDYTTYIRVTETEPTSGTYYYPIWTTGMTSGSNYTPRANDGFRYYSLEGTTSAKGVGLLFLGNSTASGTAGNKEGRLGIYGPSSYYAYLYGPDTATGSFYFPNTGGTLVTHATRGTAVGAAQIPVYIAASGRATACTIGAGSGNNNRCLMVTNGSNGMYYTSTITGNYATGDLISTVSDATYVKHTCTNSNGSVSLYAATNRGLYDNTNGAWIIYLTTAADHVYVPKWASKGSSTAPVYFNSSGEPTAGSTYAGGTKVTLNGTAKGASTATIYAPTAAGTSGQYLIANNSGIPSWTTINPYDANISRTANTVLAAPNGSKGGATFRKLVAADIPTLAISKISGLQSALDGKSGTGHTHNYAGSSSAGGAATTVVCSAATSDNNRPIVGTNTSNQIYYSTKATVNWSTGRITCGAITITDTTAVEHIKFSRANSYNYVTFPSGSHLAFISNGKSISSTTPELIVSTNVVYPGTTNVTSLGTSSLKWSNVYATTFTGKMSTSFTVFGQAYNGSAAKTVTGETLVGTLSEGTSNLTDGTMLLTSYASDNGFADTNAPNKIYKRKASCVWGYIKGKTDAAYAPKSHTHSAYYDSGVSRTANTVLAAPNGSAGSATFRKLVAADLPSHTHSGYAASSHTHNYAGSSSAGGAATSANKLNTNAGSAKKPVYFSGGVPVQVTGCMVQYWAIYEVYFSPSGTSGSIITKKAGNHNFCSSISSNEALGQIIVNTSYPSGFDESTTMIFGVGDHAETYHHDSVYITVNKQYGSGTRMRLILADDDRQNWGYAHLYFLCIG